MYFSPLKTNLLTIKNDKINSQSEHILFQLLTPALLSDFNHFISIRKMLRNLFQCCQEENNGAVQKLQPVEHDWLLCSGGFTQFRGLIIWIFSSIILIFYTDHWKGILNRLLLIFPPKCCWFLFMIHKHRRTTKFWLWRHRNDRIPSITLWSQRAKIPNDMRCP